MTSLEQKKTKKIFVGEVVSDKMQKTVTVQTVRVVTHSKFHKTLRTTKKYKVHDENELAKVGDVVEFCEGRPVSKMKHMHLVRVVKVGVASMHQKQD